MAGELAGLAPGPVTSRADALLVTEAIERLLDAGDWAAADDLYVTRCGTGAVFRHLPAAGLGQRAASAFAGTPGRQAACADQLSPDDLTFYLNDLGLHAMQAGDLAVARDCLAASVQHDRDRGATSQLAGGLRNLSEGLAWCGLLGPATDASAEALGWAGRSLDDRQVRDTQAHAGWLAGLAGDALAAEGHFLAADLIELAVTLPALAAWAQATGDEAEDARHGWATRAGVLHARLVPPGLDPDPLGTGERLLAEQRAADDVTQG